MSQQRIKLESRRSLDRRRAIALEAVSRAGLSAAVLEANPDAIKEMVEALEDVLGRPGENVTLGEMEERLVRARSLLAALRPTEEA